MPASWQVNTMFRPSSYASVVSGSAASLPSIPRPPGVSPLSSSSRSSSPIWTQQATGTNPGRAHPRANRVAHSPPNHMSSPRDGHGVPSGQASHSSTAPSPDSMPSFFVPSYLRGSSYADKVEQQHHACLSMEQDSSLALSLESPSHRITMSHRGMTTDVVERPPNYSDEDPLMWPTRLSQVGKAAPLDLADGGRELRFSGHPKPDDTACAARADHPMPKAASVYYFETTIIGRQKDVYVKGYAKGDESGGSLTWNNSNICIGFGTAKVPLTRPVGWESESYAYHCDDGQLYASSSNGKAYMARSTPSDVVGCCVDFASRSVFFTRNGIVHGMCRRG